MPMRFPIAAWLVIAATSAAGEPARTPADRGRDELLGRSHLPPAWTATAYFKARSLWNSSEAPDPVQDPDGYARAFQSRYGLHPAPYPNDDLPMGLRRAKSSKTGRIGLQIDCLVCHGGSIGGLSYVGLGNSQLDLESLLHELTRADGRVPPPSLFTINSARGTNNAGQVDVALLSLRNTDLSFRLVPLRTGSWMPEMDTPAWWLLQKKRTKYYDGRTDARAHRSNMQFLLADASAERLRELEPVFRDIDAFIKSIEPPCYPFPIDAETASRGQVMFEAVCARCHGTYAPGAETYPNKIVPIEVIGTDRARFDGLTDRFIDHYNHTWLGEDYPVKEARTGYQAPPLDGVWATAPYLHNGSVPTLYHLLKSNERPRRFTRPPSTDFEHYDKERVGWKFDIPPGPEPQLAEKPNKDVFDSRRFGLGNQGHRFGDELDDRERLEVIEYLKTL
jgi:hypothetical protein